MKPVRKPVAKPRDSEYIVRAKGALLLIQRSIDDYPMDVQKLDYLIGIAGSLQRELMLEVLSHSPTPHATGICSVYEAR